MAENGQKSQMTKKPWHHWCQASTNQGSGMVLNLTAENLGWLRQVSYDDIMWTCRIMNLWIGRVTLSRREVAATIMIILKNALSPYQRVWPSFPYSTASTLWWILNFPRKVYDHAQLFARCCMSKLKNHVRALPPSAFFLARTATCLWKACLDRVKPFLWLFFTMASEELQSVSDMEQIMSYLRTLQADVQTGI